jgi:hypothetical protein
MFVLIAIVPHPFFSVLKISRGIRLPRWTTRFGHVRPHPQRLLHSSTTVPESCWIKPSTLYENFLSSKRSKHSHALGSLRSHSLPGQVQPALKWSSRVGTLSPRWYSSIHLKTRGGAGSSSTSLTTHTGGPDIFESSSRKSSYNFRACCGRVACSEFKTSGSDFSSSLCL